MPRFRQNNFVDLNDFSVVEDSHVRVKFANPKEFFYAGERLVGNIIVSLGRAIRCEMMALQLKGYCHVRWQSFGDSSSTVHQNGEEYFNTYTVLLAPQPPDEDVTIPQGELNYRFEFTLPAHLPPTMNTPPGIVSYYIKVEIVGILPDVQGKHAQKKKHKFSENKLMCVISFKVSQTKIDTKN